MIKDNNKNIKIRLRNIYQRLKALDITYIFGRVFGLEYPFLFFWSGWTKSKTGLQYGDVGRKVSTLFVLSTPKFIPDPLYLIERLSTCFDCASAIMELIDERFLILPNSGTSSFVIQIRERRFV